MPAKKIHFIGICGAGMSAVAGIMKQLGHEVTGSDENFYPPVSTYLEQSGIKFFKGYSPKNLPSGVNAIIIGKHAKLTPQKNEEVKAAFNSRTAIKSFAEILGEVSRSRKNIVVAGSYGKSTCTALLAWCLEHAGKNPGYFIGAIPTTPAQSSNIGTASTFILEGDEYPSSNWDSGSKFLHYHPNHLLLTSLSHDHLNIFKTPEAYQLPFKKLLGIIPSNGLIVACSDGEKVSESLERLNKTGQTVFYGLNNKTGWHAENIRHGEILYFDIFCGPQKILEIQTKLIGNHNIENILGVSAMLLSLQLATPQELSQAIPMFEPLQRRLDKKTELTSIPTYEGFGSSRDKAKAAISAMKIRYPKHKLVVIFEPHTFSWRDRQALSWYDDVFSDADKVLIYKPSEHSAQPNQLTLNEIVERVKSTGVNVDGFKSVESGLAIFKKNLDNNSSVLMLSSGGFDGLINQVVGLVESKFPKNI